MLHADLARWCAPDRPYQEAQWSWLHVAYCVLSEQGCWAVIEYRFRQWTRTLGLWGLPLQAAAECWMKLVEITAGISISSKAQIGAGLFIAHHGSIIIGGDVRIGENCNLSHDVTVGDHYGSPTIGREVYLAPGAKIFGPIFVGDGCSIGANVVVGTSVPAFCVAVAGRPTLIRKDA